MKIAINLLYLEKNTNSGVGKHIEDILIGLETLNVLDDYYLIIRRSFYDDYFHGGGERRPFCQVHLVIRPDDSPVEKLLAKLKKGDRLARDLYANYLSMPKLLKQLDPDLVLQPFNTTGNAFQRGYPNVIVIHDLFYKHFSTHKKALLSRLYLKYVQFKHWEMLHRAEMVIAISQFVKSDILHYFADLDSSKIVVITNAVSASVEASPSQNVSPPYICCMNEHSIHKNHMTLLKAFDRIRHQVPHTLVFMGAYGSETPSILNYIQKNGLTERVKLVCDIADKERNWIYRHADLMISPSLHEGFGRTPIEAAMQETMVLTSTETSLPEATLDLIDYYEPATDDLALAEKIMSLLSSPTPESELKKIAAAFKEQYAPAKIAAAYHELFSTILR